MAEVCARPVPTCPDGAPASDRGSAGSALGQSLRGWSGLISVVRCSGVGSALALLVARVGTDDHDPAVAPDDPALVADLLDARLDLHGLPSRWWLATSPQPAAWRHARVRMTGGRTPVRQLLV